MIKNCIVHRLLLFLALSLLPFAYSPQFMQMRMIKLSDKKNYNAFTDAFKAILQSRFQQFVPNHLSARKGFSFTVCVTVDYKNQ